MSNVQPNPHRKPWPKSKTSDISKQSPSPLHHTFLLGRALFTAQPLSALIRTQQQRNVTEARRIRASYFFDFEIDIKELARFYY